MNKEINKILIAGTEYDIRDSRFKELTELEKQVSANEQARVAAETIRESSETDRANAEAARADAENARAEEFATFTATLAGKENAANKVTSINADADDVHYPSAKAVKDSLAKVKNIEVTPDMLSESTKQFINASGGGTITNFADDEDLTTVDNALKLADKAYDPITYSGMGRKYLRKNLVDGKNILTQEMLPSANTIYIIQYDYDLDGGVVEIPENCVLFFNGGMIQNGSLIYSNTLLLGNVYIDCACAGAIKNDYATPEMYGYNGGDLYNSLQSAINSNPFVKIKAGDYTLGQTIRVPSNRKIIGDGKVLIKSEIPAYDFATSPFKDGSIVNVAMFALRGIEDGVDYSEFSNTSGDFLCGVGTALTSGTYKSNYLDVADASGFAEGDVILVSEGLGYWHYVTQEIAEIASISGNRINIKNPLRYQYSVGTDSIGNFFKNFANPEQPIGEQPILADFVACGIRKIKPVENVVISNIILDTSTEGATSKLGLFATLSKNVLFDNIRMPKGRIWMTDSQDVVYNACSTGETNSYAGNGSNHIVYKDCVFTGGLQIEEGASDVAINDSLILSTSTPFSIIAHCKNIVISHCNIVGEYTNNVAAVSNKCKNITFIGCSMKGGSTAFRYYGSSFVTAYPDATDYSANKELTEYYDSTINLLASSFVGATGQKSIYNEHTSAKVSIISVISRNGIYGNYEGACDATYFIENIDVSNRISINGGKNAIIGLLQTSAQLNPATYVVDGRGAWGGESNGGGASVEGTQHWTAIGCRNGGANGKLMQNGYDFGIFHPNNTQKLFYREGTESTYHPILSDNNGLSCTSSDRPTASHRALGVCYFDTTLNKPIWWNGSAWVDATGATV